MSNPQPGVPGRADVEAAARRIAGIVRVTPVLDTEVGGVSVALKLEHLQRTGSFKLRGATNALLGRSSRRPVVAVSGGNHGLGVATAATETGVAATVVVPESVPAIKARRIAEAGATVVRSGRAYAAAEAHARELAEETGADLIHPFADPLVIAGQGTVGLELSADCDAVLVSVGGGGLISGIALALEGSAMRVIGVEPEGIPTMHAALAAGEPVEVDVRSVTASALGAARTSPLNLAIVQRAVEDVLLVSDEQILAARDLLWETCRLAVEPGAAVAPAALLAGLVEAERPCVVLCGANTQWTPGP
jgi:threonine dehydratase